MSKKIFFIISLVGVSAFSKVNYNCYAIKDRPAQVFLAGSLNCEKSAKSNVVTAGASQTDVVCMEQALCEPLGEGEKPTQISDADIEKYSQMTVDAMMGLEKSSFKLSTLSCKGTAKVADGNIVAFTAHCPAPSECKKDVIYNTSFANSTVSATNVVSPQSETTKNGVSR